MNKIKTMLYIIHNYLQKALMYIELNLFIISLAIFLIFISSLFAQINDL